MQTYISFDFLFNFFSHFRLKRKLYLTKTSWNITRTWLEYFRSPIFPPSPSSSLSHLSSALSSSRLAFLVLSTEQSFIKVLKLPSIRYSSRHQVWAASSVQSAWENLHCQNMPPIQSQTTWNPDVIATVVYRVIMVFVSLTYIWRKYRQPLRTDDRKYHLLSHHRPF